MNCEEMEVRLAEMLAGELGDRAPVEAHLLECAACRSDFEFARRGWAAEWKAPQVPATLAARVRKTVDAPSRAIVRLRYATAAAAALLLAALSFSTIYKPSSEECNKAPREVRYIPAKARTAPISAYVSPGVGLMVAKDLDGRPVGELSIARHDVRIEILDGVAKTTIEEIFVNHTDKRLEGTFHFPLPADASISRLAMEINGKLMEGTCLERQRAREVYEGIVRKMCDPALLEWMPGNIFKCRIFPIESRGEKRVIIGYTQALPYFDGRMKYVYPLASEKAKEHALGRVSIEAALRFKGSLKRVECPSHRADVAMKDAHEATARYEARDLRPENDFVLDLQLDDRQEFTRVPHKVDGEDGYFMALYTPQGKRDQITAPRKVAFVIDVSASVSGADLDVSRQVVEALLDKLGDKDSFVLLSHNLEAARFAGSKREALDFLARLKTGGASDLLAALRAAAAERPDEIVYVGKGVPTFGEKEKFDFDFSGSLRTIAVGSRSGTDLLDRLALQYRGASFAINPSDFVASRIREIVSTFGSELITDIRVEGSEVIYDLAPAKPRNLYAGERLVLTGRWRGSAGTLKIAGREFSCAFPAKEEGNNFVRRLWAQRKIAELLSAGEAKKADVVALSVKHQIMTPFTSFLVLENEEAYKQWNIDRQKQEQDKLLAEQAKGRTSDEYNAEVVKCLEEGIALYRSGRYDEAHARFERGFQKKPSSDLISAFLQRIGSQKVASMMNCVDRHIQEDGHRLFELAKPGEHLREPGLKGEASTQLTQFGTPVNSMGEEKKKSLEENGRMFTRPDDYNKTVSFPSDGDFKHLGFNSKEEYRRILEDYKKILVESGERTMAQTHSGGISSETKIPGFNRFALQLEDSAIEDYTRAMGYDEARYRLERSFRTPLIGQTDIPRQGLLDGAELTYRIQDFPGTDVTLATGAWTNNNTSIDIGPDFDSAPNPFGGRMEFTGGGRRPGFITSESARLSAWDVRASTFHTLLRRDALTGIGVDTIPRTEGGAQFMTFLRLEHPKPDPQDLAKDMEARIQRLKWLQPPATYKAKLQEGQFTAGKPSDNQTLEERLKEFPLLKILQEYLTRDASGKTLGTIAFDWGTNSFIVRDTPAVQEKIQEIVKRFDTPEGLKMMEEYYKGGPPPTSAAVVSVSSGMALLNKGQSAGMKKGLLFSIARDGKFVGIVVVIAVGQDQSVAEVWNGCAIGRLHAGDQGAPVWSPAALLEGLSDEAKLNFASQRSLNRIRAGLELNRRATE